MYLQKGGVAADFRDIDIHWPLGASGNQPHSRVLKVVWTPRSAISDGAFLIHACKIHPVNDTARRAAITAVHGRSAVDDAGAKMEEKGKPSPHFAHVWRTGSAIAIQEGLQRHRCNLDRDENGAQFGRRGFGTLDPAQDDGRGQGNARQLREQRRGADTGSQSRHGQVVLDLRNHREGAVVC